MDIKTQFSDKIITVSELNALIHDFIDSPLFCGLEVFGEISGIRVSNGIAYFTLKDEHAEIPCTCFQVTRTYQPKDGESVIIKGNLDFWTKRGMLKLIARGGIFPVGAGALALEFERLKKRLSEEGLFDQEHKKLIPKFCSDILVVTSKTGAVIRDIVTTIRKKNPVINIVVKDVRVQGDSAAREICNALKRADNLSYDAIIVARGGGSLEDLAPFYSEELVRTVYDMKTPVISAIGHETDFSLLDFVADLRAPTPTAAGELVAYDYYSLESELRQIDERMLRAMGHIYSTRLSRLKVAYTKVSHKASSYYTNKSNGILRLLEKTQSLLANKINTEGKSVRYLIERVKYLVPHRISNIEERAKRAVGMLDALSPLKILSRGYFNVNFNGSVVTSVKEITPGDKIVARGADGVIKATVDEVEVEQ